MTNGGQKVIVRRCLSNDDAEWLRMRRALWPEVSVETHRNEMVAWLARSDGIVLVAPRTATAGLAGFAEVGARSLADGCETSPVAYLEGWYVDADMRRQGVGTALVRAAEAWAREQGFHEFASDAELENIESQQAHIAIGFHEMGRSVLYLKAL
jgi:aminoglycoside 6'-N-acetyltransferase I